MNKTNNDNSNVLNEDVEGKATSSFKNEIKRKCTACGKTFPRSQLLRILKCHKTRELIMSPSANEFGRSVYICLDKTCVNEAIKKKRIQKTFKMQLSDFFLKKLEGVLN